MREMRGQFTKIFRTRGGLKFYGELGPPLERSTPSDFRPRRTLTVSRAALVSTGDVVTCGDESLLVALSANLTNTVQFRGFEITHRLVWARSAEQVDPVTGIARDFEQIILDDALPVVVEYGRVDGNMGIETETYRIMTGADVRVGDRLGPWIVQNRKDAIGLSLLEVS